MESDTLKAATSFREHIIGTHETGKPLRLHMDVRDTEEDRERSILTFYKNRNTEWACPLQCSLDGDPAVGKGVTRHFLTTITTLAVSWDLPGVTQDNRKWLMEKMLLHVVFERTVKQLKQLRSGLKETLIWPLLTERRDTIPLFFPRSSFTLSTPMMILD